MQSFSCATGDRGWSKAEFVGREVDSCQNLLLKFSECVIGGDLLPEAVLVGR